MLKTALARSAAMSSSDTAGTPISSGAPSASLITAASSSIAPTAAASRPRRRFQGSSNRPAGAAGKRRIVNQIPDEILNDKALNEAMRDLPSNYSFEIHKTIHQLRRDRIQTVALQMPEGLMIYGPVVADILETYTYPEEQTIPGGKYEGLELLPLLLADVTYGACCIDDFTAKEMGAEMIVHYGHSCLIPVSQTTLKTLYVFVEITIDPIHLALTVRRNFPSEKTAFRQQVLQEANPSSRTEETPEKPSKEGDISRKSQKRVEIGMEDEHKAEILEATDVETASSIDGNATAGPSKPPTRLALVSTIQFVAAIQDLKDLLAVPLAELSSGSHDEKADGSTIEGKFASSLMRVKAEEVGVWRGKYDVIIPQVRPLSPGEILGCTAPKLDKDVDALLYVGDGRFHLESIMIANPTIPAFRYDPYDKKFTAEGYDHEEMRTLRGQAVRKARDHMKPSVAHGISKTPAPQPTSNLASPTAQDQPIDPNSNDEDAMYRGKEGASGWGIVLGTLGRQGSLSVLKSVTSALPDSEIPPYLLLLSELSPQKLDLLSPDMVTTFVQTSCPRLSIDWGYAFSRPLLTPYEANVALGKIQGWKGLDEIVDERADEKGAVNSSKGKQEALHGDYPMDFYSDDSLGPWTPRHAMGRSVGHAR